MPTATQTRICTDALLELADDLRKVHSIVKIGAAMRDDLARLDAETFIAFCQLLDDRLSDIQGDLDDILNQIEVSREPGTPGPKPTTPA